jgi:hypothetical protein
MVCIDTIRYIGNFAEKACITKCEIITPNGISHELDTVLIYETVEALPPRAPIASIPSGNMPSPPVSQPTAFSRPKNDDENGLGAQDEGGSGASRSHALVAVVLLVLIDLFH